VVSVVQDQLEEIGSELNAEIKEVAKELNQAGSALKDGVEDVLQDIDDKAKELTGKIKDGLNEVGNQVEDALDEMGDQANSLLGEVADEIRNAVGQMPSFNLPKAIKNSLAEPLTDAVSDAFKKAEIDLDLTPFVELSNEKNELVASFKRLNMNISNLKKEAPQLQLAIALPSLDDRFVGAFPDVLGIVQEEAIQPLQLWVYGVVKSVKTVTDIDVWKSRLDNLISQLQEEFKNEATVTMYRLKA
jgi:gas vesicle protein